MRRGSLLIPPAVAKSRRDSVNPLTVPPGGLDSALSPKATGRGARGDVPYSLTLGGSVHDFADLRAVFAAATPLRSGDALAGLAAASMEERMAARYVLAELPLRQVLNEALVPYEEDEVTRLILDSHDAAALCAGGRHDAWANSGTGC